MSRKIMICLAIVMMITVSSCGGGSNAENEKSKHKRVLVAYFSATGKTKKVAEDIARISGGDLH
ncbi:MAG: flavodoxin, partial [Muribaculaceae bacterium]|nr:flavodoxin [Muribaculaceae bacterium]